MEEQALFDYIAKYIDLTNEEQAILFSKMKYRKYFKGQFLVQQGDVCNHLNFVVSGLSRTFHIDREGREHTFRFALKDWWAADLVSFFEQNPANCSVQCMENMEVVQFSANALNELYTEIPRFEHLFRIIFQNVSISLEKRILNNLSLSAKERYLIFQKQYPQFERRVPQYMIASYLGVSKQFLSKIRNQILTKKG